jgi:hypothetical protein
VDGEHLLVVLRGGDDRIPVATGSWMVGRPSGSKFSEKQNECEPLAAVRSISSTASRGSQSGMIVSGMYRPGAVAHHSSIIQSL